MDEDHGRALTPEEIERDREWVRMTFAEAGWPDPADTPEPPTVVALDSKDYGWFSGPC